MTSDPIGPDGAASADGDPHPRRIAARAIAATRRARRRTRRLWTGAVIIALAIAAVVVALALAHRTHAGAIPTLLGALHLSAVIRLAA